MKSSTSFLTRSSKSQFMRGLGGTVTVAGNTGLGNRLRPSDCPNGPSVLGRPEFHDVKCRLMGCLVGRIMGPLAASPEAIHRSSEKASLFRDPLVVETGFIMEAAPTAEITASSNAATAAMI